MNINMKTFQYLLSSFFAVTVIVSCEKSASTTNPTVKPSFEIIQEAILNTSCAISGCHASSADPSFAQHGLVLTPGKSYANLVGATPKNSAAPALGMKLVRPRDLDNSFLLHKIACESGHHATSANFGATMPMGGNFLTKGQVAFIKEWIAKGASATDGTVSESLLKDSSACQPSIVPLEVPAAGSGFQMKIDPFEIAPNFEREIFIRKNTPNTQPVFVNRIQMRGMSNSHHLVIYSFRNGVPLPPENVMRDLRNPNGTVNLEHMQNHVFLGGGTDVNNAHYFNKTSLTLKGENYINFYTVPANSVQNIAKTFDLNNLDIILQPKERKTLVKNFTFTETTRVVLLTSHFHKLGEKFVIKIFGGTRNGEIIYTNTDWEHPATVSYPTPILLKPGEGLTSEVTYYNSTNKAVSFGLTSEDEMNIIFGYYY